MPSISPERRKDSEQRRSRSPSNEAGRRNNRRRDEERGEQERRQEDQDRSPARKVDMGPPGAAAQRSKAGDEEGKAGKQEQVADLRQLLRRKGKDADADGEPTAAAAAPAGADVGATVGQDAAGGAAGATAADARKPANLGKTGGVYIPPFKLARMMAEVSDRISPEYQRLTWEALKKSLNGIINKVNTTNIKAILVEVFRENLVRGRGLFCRSMMKSQLASPSFSPVYAALTAVVNTKFPEIGELLLSRLVLQFKRSYKRNDKPVCSSAAKFIAHLINQGVAHEVLALEMLILMLEKPSDDSVEMAVEFTKEVGAFLLDVAPAGLQSIFDRFRAVLHEGLIDKRVQFIIEGLTQIRRRKFEEHPAVKPELDLVEAEDQITHQIELEDTPDPQTGLDIFKVDPEYEEHEKQYKAIMREILGEDEVSDDDGEGGKDGEDGDDEEEEEDDEEADAKEEQRQVIHDETQTNLVNLRRTIYLTIMSSMDFEEAGHKLMKIGVPQGQEIELVTMIIECCSQERTYKRFFGLLAQRFCYVNRVFAEHFADCFAKQYMIIHRLETNKLRNVASLFAHLLATDALSWDVLRCIRLTEEDTTSSSRIFIKYLFQELSSTLGLVKLNERLNDPTCQEWYDGIFPKDTQVNLRFAINFFTSIGLGGLTDAMRQFYKDMPRILAERQAAAAAANPQQSDSSSSSSDDSSSSESSSSDSDSSSSSSSDSSSSDSSDSEAERRRRRKKNGKDKGKAAGAKRKADEDARDGGRAGKRQVREEGGDRQRQPHARQEAGGRDRELGNRGREEREGWDIEREGDRYNGRGDRHERHEDGERYDRHRANGRHSDEEGDGHNRHRGDVRRREDDEDGRERRHDSRRGSTEDDGHEDRWQGSRERYDGRGSDRQADDRHNGRAREEEGRRNNHEVADGRAREQERRHSRLEDRRDDRREREHEDDKRDDARDGYRGDRRDQHRRDVSAREERRSERRERDRRDDVDDDDRRQR